MTGQGSTVQYLKGVPFVNRLSWGVPFLWTNMAFKRTRRWTSIRADGAPQYKTLLSAVFHLIFFARIDFT